MAASFRILSVCGQAGIMGVLGQPGEFGRDILRENIVCYRCLRWCEDGFTSGTLLSDMARCDGWRAIRGRVRKIEIFRWFKRDNEGESYLHGPCTFLLMFWGGP